jgi:hypothetical protein
LVAYSKFNLTVQKLVRGTHNLNSNTIKVALYTGVPVAADALYATTLASSGVTEVANGNGYTTGGNSGGASISSNVTGTETVKTTTAITTWTASAAGFTLRAAAAYDFTTVNKDLLGFWDYGSSLVLSGTNADTFSVIGLDTSLFTLA